MIDDPEGFIRANTVLRPTPHAPEVRLHVADQVMPIWNLTEEALDELGLAPPFWAFAWAGGQAVARHLLDHPEIVAGKSVFDFASGSGLCAIAAMLAGADRVLANDVDPFCRAAITLNAQANGVVVDSVIADLLDRPPPAVDVILAGDICYEKPLAERVMAWLTAGRDAGAHVLIGDPGRTYFPRHGLVQLAEHQVPTTRELEDYEIKRAGVWTLAP